MRNARYSNKSEMLSYIVLFFICLAIGYFLGIWLVEVLFTVISQFFLALKLLIGTIFALAILLILVFSGSIWYTIRIALYGLFSGVIISIILGHSLMQSLGSEYTGGASFWVPVAVIILIVIFMIIYLINRRYFIGRRTEFIITNKKR